MGNFISRDWYCSILSNYRRKMEVGAVVDPRASGPVYRAGARKKGLVRRRRGRGRGGKKERKETARPLKGSRPSTLRAETPSRVHGCPFASPSSSACASSRAFQPSRSPFAFESSTTLFYVT